MNLKTLGRRAIARGLESIGVEPPRGDDLQATTLVSKLISNKLPDGLGVAVSPESAPPGRAARLGAIALPPRLGIGPVPQELAASTWLMTLGWSLFGGEISAEVARLPSQTVS